MSRDWTANPLTDFEHARADMAAGRFPHKSPPEVAMAEIDPSTEPPDIFLRADAWLRQCAVWMMSNDLDMKCPMRGDPEAIADELAAAVAQLTELAKARW